MSSSHGSYDTVQGARTTHASVANVSPLPSYRVQEDVYAHLRADIAAPYLRLLCHAVARHSRAEDLTYSLSNQEALHNYQVECIALQVQCCALVCLPKLNVVFDRRLSVCRVYLHESVSTSFKSRVWGR